jgi:hypothetical protein
VPENIVLTVIADGPPAGLTNQSSLDPIAEILGQAFAELCETRSTRNETRLREIVFIFVTRLKARGMPPERVLIATKAAITTLGEGRPPSLADSLGNAGHASRHRAYRQLFEWLLEAYFE